MSKTGNRAALFVLAFLIVCSAAWGRKFPLTTTPVVPAAKGEINAKVDRNGNTDIDLKLEHMAKATSLTPPATTYVVWFQESDDPPKAAGELKVGDNLKAEFKTTTRMKNFRVFGTAESDPLTREPTGKRVFEATIQE